MSAHDYLLVIRIVLGIALAAITRFMLGLFAAVVAIEVVITLVISSLVVLLDGLMTPDPITIDRTVSHVTLL
jgi:hypothetical protein